MKTENRFLAILAEILGPQLQNPQKALPHKVIHLHTKYELNPPATLGSRRPPLKIRFLAILAGIFGALKHNPQKALG